MDAILVQYLSRGQDIKINADHEAFLSAFSHANKLFEQEQYREGLEILEKLASRPDPYPFALGCLANLLSKGFGEAIPKDIPRAISLFEQAAKAEEYPQLVSEVNFQLGVIYRADNPDKALTHLKRAVDLRHAGAMHELGEMYEMGSGVTQSTSEAISWYTLAANKMHTDSMFKLGRVYQKLVDQELVDQELNNDNMQSDDSFDQEINNDGMQSDDSLEQELINNLKAEDNSDQELTDNTQIVENISNMIHWYKEAAEKGHVNAMYQLGKIYHLKKIVAADISVAINWLTYAAKGGHTLAMCDLGEIYDNQDDIDKMIECYTLAANKGYVPAMLSLARFYEHRGDGEKSITWYTEAANTGHSNSMYVLSYRYRARDGSGDQQRADDWLIKALEHADPLAWNTLLPYVSGGLFIAGHLIQIKVSSIDWSDFSPPNHIFSHAFLNTLMTNETVESLKFNVSEISDGNLKELVDALKRNGTFQKLTLISTSTRPISLDRRQIIRGLFDQDSISSLSELITGDKGFNVELSGRIFARSTARFHEQLELAVCLNNTGINNDVANVLDHHMKYVPLYVKKPGKDS